MKLIDKSALVAEIKRLLVFYSKEIEDNKENPWAMDIAKRDILQEILSFLDTLEVKEVDLEKDVRQIFSLYYEGIKYYNDVIKEERKENGGSDLAIKILDGVIDARELGIQYVIDKLKAQKGE